MRFNVVPGTSQDVALKGLQQAAGDLQNSVAGRPSPGQGSG